MRSSSVGKRLLSEMGERPVRKILSRAFLALRRSFAGQSDLPITETLRPLIGFLRATSIDPAWLARWCTTLFNACRGALEGDDRIMPRELASLRVMLSAKQERVQGALFDLARDWVREEGGVRTLSDAPGRSESVRRLRAAVRERTRELRLAEERHRDLVEHMDALVLTVDEQFRISSVTGPGLRLVGLTDREVIGRPVRDFVPGPYLAELGVLRKRLLSEKKLSGVTFQIADTQGKELAIECSVSLVEREGRPVGAIVIARDMTTRLRLEEELRARREAVERIMESAADGIVATNRLGYVTFFSRGAEEIFGYSAADVLHKPLGAFFASPEEGGQALVRRIVAGGGRLLNYECPLRRRDGREIVVSLSASLILDEKRDVIGFLGVCRDVTEKSQAENLLRRKNKELEVYAQTVSHDLKSPLVSIQGFTSLLQETCADQLPASARKYLDRIRENVLVMGRLISELLDLSTAGQVTGEPSWVAVEDIVRSLEREYGPRLGQAGIRLEIREPLPMVLSDEIPLRQVFANLIGNALEHMGRVDDDAVVVVEAKPAEQGHILCVADNGVGIPADLHQRIFTAFETHSSSSRGLKYGLGLSIVKKIVEGLGGRIWVESEPGRGATFNLHFPQTKA